MYVTTFTVTTPSSMAFSDEVRLVTAAAAAGVAAGTEGVLVVKVAVVGADVVVTPAVLG